MMRGTRPRSVFRLDLDCPHTAFALPGEAHDKRKSFFCHACGGWARIMGVERLDYVTGPPKALRSTKRGRRDSLIARWCE